MYNYEEHVKEITRRFDEDDYLQDTWDDPYLRPEGILFKALSPEHCYCPTLIQAYYPKHFKNLPKDSPWHQLYRMIKADDQIPSRWNDIRPEMLPRFAAYQQMAEQIQQGIYPILENGIHEVTREGVTYSETWEAGIMISQECID